MAYATDTNENRSFFSFRKPQHPCRLPWAPSNMQGNLPFVGRQGHTQEVRTLLYSRWKMRLRVPSNIPLTLLICFVSGNTSAVANIPSFSQFSLGLGKAPKQSMRKAFVFY